jgi:hypothetical protein
MSGKSSVLGVGNILIHFSRPCPPLSFLNSTRVIQCCVLNFFGMGNSTLANADAITFQFEYVAKGLCHIYVRTEFWGSPCRHRTISTCPTIRDLTVLFLACGQIHLWAFPNVNQCWKHAALAQCCFANATVEGFTIITCIAAHSAASMGRRGAQHGGSGENNNPTKYGVGG